MTEETKKVDSTANPKTEVSETTTAAAAEAKAPAATTATPNPEAKAPAAAAGDRPRPARSRGGDRNRGRGGDRGKGKGRGRGGKRQERPKPEFDQKIVSIRRVVRVMGGGRRFSFSVCMVIGDRKGRVGVGLGKAGDTALAIDKAIRDAKKNMIKVTTTESGSIPFATKAKYCGSIIEIRPAPDKGLVAGGAVRTVLEHAGLKDVGGKILSRSHNHLNNARATVIALQEVGESITK